MALSYPKPRDTLRKFFTIERTDSSTVKFSLPKGAIVTGVFIDQKVNASTAAGAFNLGWSGSTTALVNAFSMATTAVGFVTAGTSRGTAVMGAALDSDKDVICTYTVGSSTAGGTGTGYVEYFIPGPGETITS